MNGRTWYLAVFVVPPCVIPPEKNCITGEKRSSSSDDTQQLLLNKVSPPASVNACAIIPTLVLICVEYDPFKVETSVPPSVEIFKLA